MFKVYNLAGNKYFLVGLYSTLEEAIANAAHFGYKAKIVDPKGKKVKWHPAHYV